MRVQRESAGSEMRVEETTVFALVEADRCLSYLNMIFILSLVSDFHRDEY